MSRGTPFVSVLMPVHNGASTIGRAVDSIRKQSLEHWELLAVDDMSTDASIEVLREIAREDERVRVLRSSERGLVAALRTGLSQARGSLIARMDADDESLPDRLIRQSTFLQNHPGIGLVGAFVEFTGDRDHGEGYARHVDWLNSIVTPDEIAKARFIESPFAHPSVTFRKELILHHGSYSDGPFPEDYELWLRWLEAGVQMAKVPEVLLRWHDSKGRLSRTDPRYSTDAIFRLKAHYLARWLRQNVDGERTLVVWGAGRVTRRRVELLVSHGVGIGSYIDVDPDKQGRHRDGRVVRAPESLTNPSSTFVIGYVGSRGARAAQRTYLDERGFVEGKDYVFAA